MPEKVTPLYTALMWEIRKQILDLGMTMEDCDLVARFPERYCAKMLSETDSGRQARWEMVQKLFAVIYHGGFILRIKPRADLDKIRAVVEALLANDAKMRNPLSMIEKKRKQGVAGKVPIRDYSRFAGRRGGAVRAHNLSPKQRTRIARRAAKARWARERERATSMQSLRQPRFGSLAHRPQRAAAQRSD